MAAITEEQTLRYLGRSRMGPGPGSADLLLATSGGRTLAGPADHPVLFDGFLGHPEQAAAALLAVAAVARTRFFTPPGMLAAILRTADPVVTCSADRLRFESFSACCGVYARFDALPGSLDGTVHASGTTNVDVNAPLRAALSRVGGLDPLHLRVGEDLVVRTLDAEVTEKKVPLPQRWLKGFAEVQLASAAVRPMLEVPAHEARRFLRSLPRGGSGRRPFWAVAAGRGVRITTRPRPDGVALSGPERLRPLEPLLRFARSLRAYSAPHDPHGTIGLWELELEDARIVLALSPAASRGFSGEGGVLTDLVDERSAEDAELVAPLLNFSPRIDIGELSVRSGLDDTRVARALGRLGAAGRVGFDAAEGAFFHRELPYDAAALAPMHPRLRSAVALADAGAVRIDGGTAHVRSGGTEHRVRRTETGDRCTCPWYAAHGGSRGPCAHVLAVETVRRRRT